METEESINKRYNEKTRKYFKVSKYAAILGITIGLAGFARNYYQTNNIPGMHPLSNSNLAMVFTGISIGLTSVFAPIALNARNKRKRDNELESLTDFCELTHID